MSIINIIVIALLTFFTLWGTYFCFYVLLRRRVAKKNASSKDMSKRELNDIMGYDFIQIKKVKFDAEPAKKIESQNDTDKTEDNKPRIFEPMTGTPDRDTNPAEKRILTPVKPHAWTNAEADEHPAESESDSNPKIEYVEDESTVISEDEYLAMNAGWSYEDGKELADRNAEMDEMLKKTSDPTIGDYDKPDSDENPFTDDEVNDYKANIAALTDIAFDESDEEEDAIVRKFNDNINNGDSE